jgi:hypothetical protein
VTTDRILEIASGAADGSDTAKKTKEFA